MRPTPAVAATCTAGRAVSAASLPRPDAIRGIRIEPSSLRGASGSSTSMSPLPISPTVDCPNVSAEIAAETEAAARADDCCGWLGRTKCSRGVAYITVVNRCVRCSRNRRQEPCVVDLRTLRRLHTHTNRRATHGRNRTDLHQWLHTLAPASISIFKPTASPLKQHLPCVRDTVAAVASFSDPGRTCWNSPKQRRPPHPVGNEPGSGAVDPLRVACERVEDASN
jgi:hypothetical protein